jgi:hypothetical protein
MTYAKRTLTVAILAFAIETGLAIDSGSVAAMQTEAPVQEKVAEAEDPKPEESRAEIETVQPKPVPRLFGFEESDGMLNRLNSMSARTTDNVTKVVESRNGQVMRTAEFTFDGDAISVLITRDLGRQQWEEMIDEAPGLLEYAESFPETAGEFNVEISVRLSQTFSADSLEKFSKTYPSIYQRYRRVLSSQFGDVPMIVQGPLAGLGRFENLPGMRPLPLPAHLTKHDPKIRNSMVKMMERMTAQIEKTEIELKDLEIERDKLIADLGAGHPRILEVKKKIKKAEALQRSLKSRLPQIKAMLGPETDEPNDATAEEDKVDEGDAPTDKSDQ